MLILNALSLRNISLKSLSLAPSATSKRLSLIVLAIACLALGVRLLQWQNNFLGLDKNMTVLTARYKEEAEFLLTGDLTSFVRGSKSEADAMILTHPPGYPIVMATIYKLSGKSDRALRLFQIACESVAAVLVFLIAFQLIPRGAAVLAALLVAVSPQLAFRSLLLLPDSLAAVPLLAAIFLIVKATENPSVRKMILAGALIGVSCWLRPDVLLLPLFLCASFRLFLRRGQRLRHALALIGGMAIVVAPVTIRNVLVFRSFVPISLGTGVTMCEGIADYDVEQRFGLSPTDVGTNAQEAQWAGRPDYAANLYRPDGIERERGRVQRALSVMRSDPIWFVGTMLRRTGVMLTYERVPIISAEPTVSHSLEIARDAPLVWSSSSVRIESDDKPNAIQFITKPIKLQKNYDYLLTVPVKIQQGKVSITVRGIEWPQILASAAIPDSLERLDYTNEFAPTIQMPFVNTNHDEVQVVIANVESTTPRAIVDVGGMQLTELGPAAYLWTKYPRKLVKSVQKQFVTSYFLPMTILGVIILALYRRKVALAFILTVPVYYLLAHAPMHVEYRYLLPAHFFWFMLVGLAIYWLGLVLVRVTSWIFFGQRE